MGSISQCTLTLRGLERDGLVTRTVLATIPPRVDDELTKLGRSLLKPVRAILAETKFSLVQLYHWLDGAPQVDGSALLLPPIPRRWIIVRKEGRAATRVALV